MPEYSFIGIKRSTPAQIQYAATQQSTPSKTTKTIYSNFEDLFDEDNNLSNGFKVNYNNLINKQWLRDRNNRLKIAGGPGFNEKDFRKFGESALNYQKYYDDQGVLRPGVDSGKALKAKEEYEKYQTRVGQFAQSLRQTRYGVDENGNPIEYYEGEKEFTEGDKYNTADEARAAYAQQQQYNKDARSWAGRNYMEKNNWDALKYDPANGFKDHDTVIDHLVSLAGDNISKETIDKAKKGGIWGNASNQIFQAALDNLAKTNYKEAIELYNSIRNKYSDTGSFRFEKGATLYDGSNAFTDANKRNWLESEAGVNDVNKFYETYKGNSGYMDDYQDYVKKQKEVADWQKENGGFGASYSTQFKQGGKMNKYQQGGQAPTAAQMVLQALSAAQQGDQSGLQQLFSDKKTAQAVIQQLQKEAQEGSEEAIQALEALKQIMSGSKKQATIAQKGAKLSYIHRLATGCPPGMEMTYFKKGGRICKACIEKAKKAKEGASLDNIIAKNKERYPGITDDQAAGRAPIRKNGKDYYLDGDGVLGEASKKGKYGFGGFFEYFKSGGKNPVKRVSKEITDDGYEMKFSDGTSSNYGRNPMNGKSVAIGRDGKTYTGEKADSVLRTDSQKTVPAIKANKKKSMACGGKAKKSKCGTKAKCGAELEKCGGKTPMDKCGGKTTLAKCGAELEKCGGKAKKISSKKPTVNKDKCGGKAKKHAIGGNLELLKYMILNYNK